MVYVELLIREQRIENREQKNRGEKKIKNKEQKHTGVRLLQKKSIPLVLFIEEIKHYRRQESNNNHHLLYLKRYIYWNLQQSTNMHRNDNTKSEES
jgi:hypothetical protein